MELSAIREVSAVRVPEGVWMVSSLSAIMYEPAGVFLLSMHPYRWSREVCVIANYITFGMVSRPCLLDGASNHL